MKTQIEKPMLFTAPMVRALLEDRKTQTRRIIKPQPLLLGGEVEASPSSKLPSRHPVGSRIWVKETHYWDRYEKLPKTKPGDFPRDFYYRADGECCEQIPECQCGTEGKPCWRPSIFMPRWASRINLEVTRVWVERLQDISEEDAVAEGMPTYEGNEHMRFAREEYEGLWNVINGPGTWAKNPWVWVYEFKRVRDAVERVPTK